MHVIEQKTHMYTLEHRSELERFIIDSPSVGKKKSQNVYTILLCESQCILCMQDASAFNSVQKVHTYKVMFLAGPFLYKYF